MALFTRTFRIFVSSTFSDLKAERNALQERVFPRLRELAAAHGSRFQVIDLRWGVSEEAALAQAEQLHNLFLFLEQTKANRPRERCEQSQNRADKPAPFFQCYPGSQSQSCTRHSIYPFHPFIRLPGGVPTPDQRPFQERAAIYSRNG